MSTESPARRMRALAAAATIGTDRSALDSGPGNLLNAAAVFGAQARAGYRPRRLDPQAPACPPDARPAASAAAMATLVRLLSNPDAGLIEEWAELAQARGVRVADSAAPLLLDWWSRQPRRADVVCAVLGERGKWLASLNTEWRRPAVGQEIPSNAEELWTAGRAAERAALLQTVRRHDPACALRLVQSTWPSDGADERRRFLELLGQQCSMADEPFLESALDDKSKLVRRQAAQVLGLIPESRFRARMAARAGEIIVMEGGRGLLRRTARVRLNPPAQFQKEWERDGIERQPPGRIGNRVWWMRQILAAAGLSIWNEVTGLAPEAVLDAIHGDDYFEDALQALVEAAECDADADWCRSLMRRLLDRDEIDIQALSRLWARLPRAKRESLMLEAVEHRRLDASSRWALLATAGERWSREFSQRVMQALSQRRPAGDEWPPHESIERLSRLICPDAADAFEKAAATWGDQAMESFRKSVERVRLRAEMHKEFAA